MKTLPELVEEQRMEQIQGIAAQFLDRTDTTWIEELKNEKAVSEGGVIHRSIADIKKNWSIEELEEWVDEHPYFRAFTWKKQYVILCSDVSEVPQWKIRIMT